MKKILIVLLVLLLVGCNTNENRDEQNTKSIDDLSIVVPSGAPSLVFYNKIDNRNFNTSDAKSILPELKSGNGSDIIVIDTVNGIKALNDGADYKIAATITFGNFYVAATGLDDNGVMEDGDYIVVFSQGAVSDLIFHNIYGNDLDSNLHYVSAVADASACLIKGINISDDERDASEDPYVEYVMIAEPALTAALAQNSNAYIYANLQNEFKKRNAGHKLIQASIFVSNKLDNELVNKFLNETVTTVNGMFTNPNVFADGVANLSDVEVKDIFGVPNSKIVTKVLENNSIGINFMRAYYIKEDIDNMLSLFGIEKTNEEIYFK